MSTVRLIYNAIIGGHWYGQGEPIEESIVPANLRKYIAKPTRSPRGGSPQLSFELNRRYCVDADGFLRGSPAEQAAQLEVAASDEEMMADELAQEPLSETLASAIEEARENHSADVERQKVEARARVEQADAAAEFVREEQDKEVKSGEFDRFESVPEELSRVNSEQTEDSPQRPARGGALDAKRKPDLKAKKKSYVLRGNQFLPASTVELIEGEQLYWLRKRKFGQASKFIAFARVQRKEN